MIMVAGRLAVTAMLAVMGFSLAAGAAEPPGMKGYVEAADQFTGMLKSAMDTPDLPGNNDPVARPLLQRLSDVPAVFGTSRYGKDDIGNILTICGKSIGITSIYMMAGTEEARKNLKENKLTPEQLALEWEKGLQKHQDAATPVMAFSVACVARVVSPLSEFWNGLKPEEKTDVRRKGIEQTRLGARQLITGALTVAIDKRYSMTNRELLLRALAENIDDIVGVMPLKDRRMLLLTVNAARGDSQPELSGSFDRLGKSLSREDCGELCSL